MRMKLRKLVWGGAYWRSLGGQDLIIPKILTHDANAFLAALKADEEHSEECARILRLLPGKFILAEPSVVYQEVCGVLARKVGLEVARRAEKFLDQTLN